MRLPAQSRHVWRSWAGSQSNQGLECRKSARLSCKQQDRERYPAGPPIFIFSSVAPLPARLRTNAVRSKQWRRVPWEHQKAGATPATATNFFRSQAEKSRPGAHNPGGPERYRGLPPISPFPREALIRNADCKPAVEKHSGSRRVEHYHQRLPVLPR